MRVLHVLPSIAPQHGGPTRALVQACTALVGLGIDVTIAATGTVPTTRTPGGAEVVAFQRDTDFYSTSLPLRRWLRREATRFDVIHVHELFTFPSIAGARAADAAERPYVLTPHGVLMRWGRMHRRPALKRLSIALVERRVVDRAAVVHFTTERERTESLEVVAPQRDAVFPLGLDLSEFASPPPRDALEERLPELRGRQYVLFLSRLHPVKGAETLLRSFARLDAPPVALVIAGDGDPAYVRRLRDLAADLGIAERVVFAGFLDERERLAALASALCLVQPSASESFGVSVVEALAAGIPVVATDGVALSEDVAAAGAGVAVAVSADPAVLAEVLERILADGALRAAMGERGRALAHQRFSLEVFAERLHATYVTIARGSPEAGVRGGA